MLRRFQKFWFQAITIVALAILGANSRAIAEEWNVPQTADEFLSFEKALQSFPKSSTTRKAQVELLTITRDIGTFTLSGGEIFLTGDLRGRTFAAFYRGDGEFHLDHDNKIERDHFKRMTGRDIAQVNFRNLFIIFTDSTAEELTQQLSFVPHKRPARTWDKLLKYLTAEQSKSLSSVVLEALLNDNSDKFFYAGFDGKGGPWYFDINPYNREQVRFRRHQSSHAISYREIVCQLPLNSFSSDTSARTSQLVTHKITSYDIISEIKSDLDYLGDVTVNVKSYGDAGPWLYFNLFYNMKVVAVFDSAGNVLPHVRKKDQWRIWVNIGRTLKAGEDIRLKFSTSGGLIERHIDWTYIRSAIGWYPSTRYSDTATYDLIFHTPKNYRFVAVGDMISADTVGKTITSRWLSDGVYNQASFNIGMFGEYTITEGASFPVSVMMSKEMHDRVRRELSAQAISIGKDMDKRVAADIVNAANFYTRILGPCPTESLVVTETPYSHGQAFPGLLLLSTDTYLFSDEWGEEEQFRAHEVAHLWWGFGVGYDSYHDKWLSEGFSDFFALWFIQSAYGKNKEYFKFLKDWRKRIIGNRKYLFGSGQEGGPISLGYRTSSKETSGDFGLIVYQKGAWVLHMLRNMMLDLETLSDDLFIEVMREFYTRYEGKEPSTDDFRLLIEEFVGMDMNWFFDQWVHGTDIPKYKFAYITEQDSAGNYLVTCRVRQEEVSPDFKMFVPIRIELKGSDYPIRLQVFITGEESIFALPPFASKPKKIVFNDMESVLCEVDNEGW